MKSIYPSKLIMLIALLFGFNASLFAQTTTFSFNGTTGSGNSGISGSPQIYSVPGGVSQIAVDMYGGCGGWPCCSWTTGGPLSLGGRVQCTMNVTPGTSLYVYVGGAGGSSIGNDGVQKPGGWPNGGIGGAVGSAYCGSGGGESSIRTSTSGYSASNVLAVAGAGGGGGDFGPVGGNGGGTTGGTGATGICGGGQTGPSCTTGSALGGNGVGGSSASYSDGGGGGGWWGGNCGTSDQGGGGGSSYPAAPNSVVTAIIHTQGYAAAVGNGQVVITVLCQSPGAIVGSTPVCPGSTITLTNPTGAAGGTWASSNPGVATINSSTGVVTGVSAGTTTITYVETNPCGGTAALATTTVTVLPLPGPITGTTNACTTFSTTLSDAGGGTWVSSNPAVATVSSSGVVSGLTAGVTTISYTLPTGCAPATTPVTINTFPAAISGTLSVCAAGATTALSDALTGGTWNSGTTAVATIGAGSGIVTGLTAGTTSITYTAPTGCTTSSIVTVNPLPAPISGASSVCVGSTATVTDATGGGSWTSSNTSQATVGIGTGLVTGIVAGSPSIIYTLAGTGCHISAPMIVNPLPSAISGSSHVCVGGTTPLSDAGGGTFASGNPLVATVNAFSGVVSGIAAGTTNITYTLGTGCSTSTTMLVNGLPTAYTLLGGGSYCAGGTGADISLSYGSSGVSYTLYNGTSAVSLSTEGANSGLDFNSYTAAGSYTAVGTNDLTGCTGNMSGSVTITINPLPGLHNITGGGAFCMGTTGSPLGTDGSDPGIHYQLYNGATAVGPVVNGTGGLLSFGTYATPGTYTVKATNPTTGCSQVMGGTAVISIAPPPTVYTVTGGGSFCAGGTGLHVYLSGSDAGTSYQLLEGGVPASGPIVSGGGPLDFGLETAGGIYTVVALNLTTGCTGNMSGSVTIIVNPLPAINTVTGGGGYCAGGTGEHIGLSFSTPGISYELEYGGGTVVSVSGSGSGLDFGSQSVPGTYTVIAVNTATGCTSTMSGSATITINPAPTGFDVTGGGSFCAGGTGLDISTDMSESGVNYQLYKGGAMVGTAIPGSVLGTGLDFGLHAATGSYTVTGVNPITGCSTAGTGTAVISVTPLPTVHNVTGGGNYCQYGTGVDVGLNGSNTGIIYQLSNSGGVIGTMSGTGSALDFGLWTATGLYTIVATDSVTGCQKNMGGSATIGINPLPIVDTVTGGGNYCAGGTGFHVGLTGSSTGVSYQLSNSGTPSGAALSGSGSALDFGVRTAPGLYTVIATNTLTGCTNPMSGRAVINVNALPDVETIGGGGNYCAGGTGIDVNLSGSDAGVNYQLYGSGVASGTAVSGTGGTLDFGLILPPGTYTAVATDTVTGCSVNMLGSVNVNTVSPVVYTVTGGGNYCAGGTGVTIGQSGSTAGVSYQLMSGGSSVGLPMTGTGTSISFGTISAAGSYTVSAADIALGCTATMAGTATVGINPLPTAENVTGGGAICAGGAGKHVGIDNSQTGVNYQLYIGTTPGTIIAGTTGSALDFGLETTGATYTVKAADPVTTCSNIMAGSVAITIEPTPTPYPVTIANAGNYCAADTGLHVYLSGSDAGDEYQLFRGSMLIGSAVTGTGALLDLGLQSVAGSYTIVASDPTTSCTSNMLGSVTVNIVPLPNVHGVTGGGGFCPGGAGAVVGLDGSDVGIYYQLYKNMDSLVSTLYGTGTALSYGLQTAPGSYTVIGNSGVPGAVTCPNNMFGTASVHTDTLLTPNVNITSYPAAGLGVWHIDSVKAFVTNGGSNPTYQWSVNGHEIPGATDALFIYQNLFNGDVVTCSVTASGPCGGNTKVSNPVTIILQNVGVGQVSTGNTVVKLVPNPNKGAFTVSGSMGAATDEEVTIEVTNMLGQVIYSGKAKTQNGNIDAQVDLGNNLASGSYILGLSSGSQHSVFHFVIQ